MAPRIEFYDISLSSSSSEDVYFNNDTGKPITAAAAAQQEQGEQEPLRFREIRQRRKRVSFGAVHSTHEVLSRHEYSPDEIENSFFGREDLKRMRETARWEARLLLREEESREPRPETGDSSSSGFSSSPRGLEHRTREGSRRKRRSRINAYAAVFFEIDHQHHERFEDADAIADAYYVYSEPCAVRATALGRMDALEAVRVRREPWVGD